jgi:hypothetical protein
MCKARSATKSAHHACAGSCSHAPGCDMAAVFTTTSKRPCSSKTRCNCTALVMSQGAQTASGAAQPLAEVRCKQTTCSGSNVMFPTLCCGQGLKHRKKITCTQYIYVERAVVRACACAAGPCNDAQYAKERACAPMVMAENEMCRASRTVPPCPADLSMTIPLCIPNSLPTWQIVPRAHQHVPDRQPEIVRGIQWRL